MPSRPDLREIASNVKEAFADADRSADSRESWWDIFKFFDDSDVPDDVQGMVQALLWINKVVVPAWNHVEAADKGRLAGVGTACRPATRPLSVCPVQATASGSVRGSG